MKEELRGWEGIGAGDGNRTRMASLEDIGFRGDYSSHFYYLMVISNLGQCKGFGKAFFRPESRQFCWFSFFSFADFYRFQIFVPICHEAAGQGG